VTNYHGHKYMSHECKHAIAHHRRGFNAEYICKVERVFLVASCSLLCSKFLWSHFRVVRALRACLSCCRPLLCSLLLYTRLNLRLRRLTVENVVTALDQILSGHLATQYFIGSCQGLSFRDEPAETVGKDPLELDSSSLVFGPLYLCPVTQSYKSVLHTPFYFT